MTRLIRKVRNGFTYAFCGFCAFCLAEVLTTQIPVNFETSLGVCLLNSIIVELVIDKCC